MIHKASKEQALYIRSMGKSLRVIAMATTDEEANDYMNKHDEAAVIACFGPFILMADKHDRGI